MKNADQNPDLATLAAPINRKYIHPAPKGKFGTYVPHYVVTQMLLATVGPFDWELVQILRGDSAGVIKRGKHDEQIIELTDVIVGAVYRLTCYIDGSRVQVEEVGETDAYLKSNEGARLKHASSDALKRCAMRLGVAIQLWCKTTEEHFLPGFLKDEAVRVEETEVEVGGEEIDEYHTGGFIAASSAPIVGDTVPVLTVEDYKAEAEHQKYKPMVETVQTNEDDWNLLLATLEVLPVSKDTIPQWIAYAEQMYNLMVATGCWKSGMDLGLKGLGKDDLIVKVTAAHAAANKKAAANAPF